MNDHLKDEDTQRIGRRMGLLATIIFIGLAWLYFDNQLENRSNPNRNLQISGTESELVLKRNSAGHYVAPGTINGQPVTFMLDTGATDVSVPFDLGKKLNLVPGRAIKVRTANGVISVRSTIIPELSLGPFSIKNVTASLNPGMDSHEEILLGMSVLKQLEFTQRGDTLILRLHQASSI